MSDLTPILERERETVLISRGQCYAMLVGVGACIMALVGMTLLFAVRPSIVHGGLPACSVDASKQPTGVVWPANRAQLLSFFGNATRPAGFLFFEGATELSTGDGDSTLPFRQGSVFTYVSGAHSLPDCFMVLDVSGTATFFLGSVDPVWTGRNYTLAEWATRLHVDAVLDAAALPAFLAGRAGQVLYTMPAYTVPPAWGNGTVDTTALPLAVDASRLVKTPQEIEWLSYLSIVSSNAHKAVMAATTPTGSEYSAEAVFLQTLNACDMGTTGYQPIVASGYNSAILHYSANNERYASGALLLVDAAGSKYQYTSDITRTFPVNGVFSALQRSVYEAVLAAQTAAVAVCQAGSTTAALTAAARGSLAQSLLTLGFVSALPAPASPIVSLFMPHGCVAAVTMLALSDARGRLSHTVGLEVHDSPGLPAVLVAGIVMTIEPGLYFNRAIFTDAVFAANPTLVRSAIAPLLDSGFGGVRIEDVYVVRATSCVALSNAPKTVDDIESLMK